MMNLYRYARSGRIILVSWFIPYTVSINWLLFGKRYFEEWQVFWKASLFLFPAFLMLSLLIDFFANRLPGQFPGAGNIVKRRTLLMLLLFIPAISLVSFIFFYLRNSHFLGYHFNIVQYYLAIVATFVITCITAGLYEVCYVQAQRISTLVAAEYVETKIFRYRLHKLKDQVDPVFFFNCLDSLKSLISQDQHKAIGFLNEMSRVYRHLSVNNRESLSTLLDELKFLHSYFQLQKARYGQSIRLKVDVADECLNSMLPTLTLQMFVENAIKYNVALEEKPLLIHIRTTEDNQLIIDNNLQPRFLIASSNIRGFEDIANKYQFPAHPGIKIKILKNKFAVTVPLLNYGS